MQLFNAGITTGCGGNYYCPEQSVSRDQMAVFILRSIYGRNYQPPLVGTNTGFYDVPTSHWAAPWIKQLAAEGITTGCGGGNYCPSQSVSRDQMAIFILRGMYGATYQPPAIGDSTGFYDVPTSHWAAAWIKQLSAEGVTTGCGGGNYCPSDPVSRAQMAVFLVRAFIENPPPPPPINNYQLSVSKVGSGSGTVTSSPTGINCGSTCSAYFTNGTSVTLTASPSDESNFSGWSGACTGTSTTCTVFMTQNLSVTATFDSSGPPPPPTTGFNSQFNGDADGWLAHSGDWLYDDNYLFTSGIKGSTSSISYDDKFANFDYQVKMKRFGEDTVANRLIIRGKPNPLFSDNNWSSGYYFQYTTGGSYSVFKINPNGTLAALQGWTYASAIVQGSEWNILRVVANSNNLSFYINDKLVWKGMDLSFSTGQVGIGMYINPSSILQEELLVDWAVLSEGGSASGIEHGIKEMVSPEQQALNESANLLGRGTIDSSE